VYTDGKCLLVVHGEVSTKKYQSHLVTADIGFPNLCIQLNSSITLTINSACYFAFVISYRLGRAVDSIT
jgi:hypothetical protein